MVQDFIHQQFLCTATMLWALPCRLLAVRPACESGGQSLTSCCIYAIHIWGFPKIRATFLGVPIRIVVYWGLYWGSAHFWETTIYMYIDTSGLYWDYIEFI